MTAATQGGPSGTEKGPWAWPPQHMRVGADSREKSHLGDPLLVPWPTCGGRPISPCHSPQGAAEMLPGRDRQRTKLATALLTKPFALKGVQSAQ